MTHLKVIGVLTIFAAIVELSIAFPMQSSSSDAIYVPNWQKRYRLEHKALTRHGEMVRAARRQIGVLVDRLELVRDPVMAIRLVFGSYADQALRVSFCETGGTFSTRAQLGQYRGLFQMGEYARARYGHSDTALGQAIAAYGYFVDSGRDWSPWECKP